MYGGLAAAVPLLPALEPPGPDIGDPAFGVQFQYVAQMNGNDVLSGLSWGAAKATLDAAVASLPNGGLIVVAPGSYYPKATLVLNGHHIYGVGCSAGSPNAAVSINCGFASVPLIQFAHGGQLTNVGLVATASAGDALYAVSPPFASPSVPISLTGKVTSITGNSPCTGFSAGAAYIAVDSEVFSTSNFAAGVFTVTGRAIGGTTAAPHYSAESPISQATVLTATAGPADKTATVASAANWPLSGYLVIGSETIFYAGLTATTFTGLQRGLNGSTAATHQAGTACLQFASRPGGIILDNVTISASSSSKTFTRDLHLDGSNNNYPGGPGIRQVFAVNGLWFGTAVAGETIVLNRVVHADFVNIDINPGPPSIRPGIKVLDPITEQVNFSNLYLAGTFESQAGGSAGDSVGTVMVTGYIDSDVTFAAGSAGNRIIGPIGGTVTNLGSATNLTDAQPWTAAHLANGWSDAPSPAPPAAYFLDPAGVVHLRGKVTGGAIGSTVFTLDDGYQPQCACLVTAWGQDQSGAFTPCAVEITPDGSVQLLSSTATAVEYLSLDGVTCPARRAVRTTGASSHAD
jgi:hypothetical protein